MLITVSIAIKLIIKQPLQKLTDRNDVLLRVIM